MTGSRGEWVCEDGEWIKLGNPHSQPPAYGCLKEKEASSKENQPTKESFEAGTPLGSVRFDLGSGLMPASYKEATESTKASQSLWTND
ncbi:MAG: hypothetical protein PHF74_08325 [Dehalococcoidales bacterium]|nr:hypothetical protein [Dehalococcoidales bacterium]